MREIIVREIEGRNIERMRGAREGKCNIALKCTQWKTQFVNNAGTLFGISNAIEAFTLCSSYTTRLNDE